MFDNRFGKEYNNRMKEFCSIVLKTAYPEVGNTADIEILGKKMLDWVKLSLDDTCIAELDYDDAVPLPILVRPYLDTQYPFTVILYSDTPLISKTSVIDAVEAIKASGQNVLKMTRGLVCKTAFLLSVDTLYTEQTHYLNEDDFVTAFSFKQIQLIGEMLKTRIISAHMANGVYFEDAGTAFIGADVKIGRNVRIAPNNVITGHTVIGNNVTVKTGNVIEDCIIDEGAAIDSSRLYFSYVGKRTKVGPFAYLRPESVIGADCRIGDFVEIKKSVIGDGCKVSHLTYVGDCEMGNGCNVGCGVVFANYDGKDKHKTVVGKNVFIGSNSNLIAPLIVGDGAFIAAGSTLTDSVPDDALAVARARQVVKPDWTGNKFKH